MDKAFTVREWRSNRQVQLYVPSITVTVTRTERSLLEVLLGCDGPCTLTDDSLAYRVKCHPRTVSGALRSLEVKGWIQRVTTPAVYKKGKFRRKREIFLASPEPVERGALLVANHLRSHGLGKRDRYIDLRCTPHQLAKWQDEARKNRWILIAADESGEQIVTFPNNDFPETQAPSPLKLPPAQGMAGFVDRLVSVLEQHGGTLDWSSQKLGDAIGCSRSYASKVVLRARLDGRIFIPFPGVRRRLVLGMPDSCDSAMLIGPKLKLLNYVEETGTITALNADLCRITGVGSTQTRKLLTELLKEGVIVARGNGRARSLWSADALAKEIPASVFADLDSALLALLSSATATVKTDDAARAIAQAKQAVAGIPKARKALALLTTREISAESGVPWVDAAARWLLEQPRTMTAERRPRLAGTARNLLFDGEDADGQREASNQSRLAGRACTGAISRRLRAPLRHRAKDIAELPQPMAPGASAR